MSSKQATGVRGLALVLLASVVGLAGCGDGNPTSCPAIARVCVAGESPQATVCGCEPPSCAPTVSPEDPLAGRFEGTGLDNACRSDRDCVVGGCSSEICSAAIAGSTCELLPRLPEGSCSCVGGQCIWAVCSGP